MRFGKRGEGGRRVGEGGHALPKLLEQREQFGWPPVSESNFPSGYLISACPASKRWLHIANKQGRWLPLSSSPWTLRMSKASESSFIATIPMLEGVFPPKKVPFASQLNNVVDIPNTPRAT